MNRSGDDGEGEDVRKRGPTNIPLVYANRTTIDKPMRAFVPTPHTHAVNGLCVLT